MTWDWVSYLIGLASFPVLAIIGILLLIVVSKISDWRNKPIEKEVKEIMPIISMDKESKEELPEEHQHENCGDENCECHSKLIQIKGENKIADLN